jgi:hypothetical protein
MMRRHKRTAKVESDGAVRVRFIFDDNTDYALVLWCGAMPRNSESVIFNGEEACIGSIAAAGGAVKQMYTVTHVRWSTHDGAFGPTVYLRRTDVAAKRPADDTSQASYG